MHASVFFFNLILFLFLSFHYAQLGKHHVTRQLVLPRVLIGNFNFALSSKKWKTIKNK